MQDNTFYQFRKLFMDYFSFWSLIFIGLLIHLFRNPDQMKAFLKAIPKYISSFRVGDFEVQLNQIEQKLAETESHISVLEDESKRLNELYSKFDVNAPVHELESTRQSLKSLAGNLDDITPVLDGLKPKANPADVYAAAEILRAKRDTSAFDALIEAVDRIASDAKLEQLRYHTVWTLASAVHRSVLAAVKHTDSPRLSVDQLRRAKGAMKKLHDNPHVQLDRPDQPSRGIRGPAMHALNWIEKGLKKYEQQS